MSKKEQQILYWILALVIIANHVSLALDLITGEYVTRPMQILGWLLLFPGMLGYLVLYLILFRKNPDDH